MNLKELKEIYGYMEWCEHEYIEYLIDPGDGGKIYAEYNCFKCQRPFIDRNIEHPLDSNTAWEVVQEIERKGDWESFVTFTEYAAPIGYDDSYLKWIMNPENFFNCLVRWLEENEILERDWRNPLSEY